MVAWFQDSQLDEAQGARNAGLHPYVTMVPTYPECDEIDLKKRSPPSRN